MQQAKSVPLLSFRQFMAVYSSAIMAIGIYATTYSYLQWLTHWGVCASVLYYTLQLVAAERLKALLETIFQVTLTIEWVIVMVYWTFVFPQYTEEERPPLWYNFSVHIFMFLGLFTDFHRNDIEFDRGNRVLPIIAIFTYGVVNATVTFFTAPIYPLLTYTNLYSFVFVLYGLVLTVVCFELLCWMSSRKWGKLGKTQELEVEMEVVTNA